MSSWLKDLQVLDMDDTHILITEESFARLDKYHESTPTSPSPGRVYARTIPAPGRPNQDEVPTRHFIYIVGETQPDGFNYHVPREVLFL